MKLGFFSFLIPQLNILLWVQPARPSSLYYGRNLPFVNLVDQSMKLYGLGKTIRRKIRLTFQQLLSSYVLVSRDVIPIGPTQQEKKNIRFRERRLIISADGLAVEPDSETERVFPTDSAQRRKWYQIQIKWLKPYAGRPIGGRLSLSSSKL